MRQNQFENLRTFSSNLIPSLEPLEMQMQLLNGVSDSDKQLWHFARLPYTDAAFIKNFGDKTFMRLFSFDSIQKKSDKKNTELAKIRTLHKKLADREKIISLDIENLQNQKVEAIFLKAKREIKHENLNVSSGSILPLLEALRNHQQSSNDTSSAGEVANQTNISLAYSDKKTELAYSDKKTELDFGENLDSISKSPETYEEPKKVGRPPLNPRKVFNGILWIFKNGSRWRDLPSRYGNWNSIYHKFRLWCESGLFELLLHLVNTNAQATTLLEIDSTFCFRTSKCLLQVEESSNRSVARRQEYQNSRPYQGKNAGFKRGFDQRRNS